MEPKTVVAIEIASSKVKGAVGTVNADGQLTVLAVEEIAGINNVRYGRVQNIREVSNVVNEIVLRLESSPNVYPRKIEAMSVSLGGRSLSAAMVTAVTRFMHDCEISESHLQALKEEAKLDYTGDKSVEAILPRAFYVDNALTPKPVGTFAETFKGDFMIITCGKETRQSLNRLKYDPVEKVVYELRHTAIADLVLSRDEKALGCALVDFGAETTTVSVYKDGTLAFLCTIPMGSRLITFDLMSGMGITEETAESYKLSLGSFAENTNGDNAKTEEISNYVHARAGEIAANIAHQLEQSGYAGGTLTSIVLTGGGAKLPGFAELLEAHCNKVSVRIASMPASVSFMAAGLNSDDNIDVVALLATGARRQNWDCLSRVAVPATDDSETTAETEAAQSTAATTAATSSASTETAADLTWETEPVIIEEKPITFKPKNDSADDDDDDDKVLEDDPDDVDDGTKQPKRKKSFSNLFRRNGHRPEEKPAPVDDEGYLPEEEAVEEPQKPDVPKPNSEEQAKKVITDARNWFTKLFDGNDGEE